VRLIITKSYEESAALCAQQIADIVKIKKDALLGLATGMTPIPVYENMVRLHKNKEVDFSHILSVNLDEYVGLSETDPNSYFYFMSKHLFDPLEIPRSRIEIPKGQGAMADEIERMNKFMDDHTIDVQLLSAGTNGHIGFNEPNSVFHDKYHYVTLTDETRMSNSRLFNNIDEVPSAAITMGIGGIMRAKCIAFLATGLEKLAVMKAILEDHDVTPKIQGTILKFHQDCTIYLDENLADKIKPSANVEVGYSNK
jgi:glucosamine-6-phosphate deaminase